MAVRPQLRRFGRWLQTTAIGQRVMPVYVRWRSRHLPRAAHMRVVFPDRSKVGHSASAGKKS